jgi:mutator protein MutT
MKQTRNVSVILLYNDNKEILLQHRDENITVLPGYWSFFGGASDENETPENAVRRETKEELEYELTNPRLVMTQKFDTEIHSIIRYVYIEKYNPDTKLVLHEGQGMDWHKCSAVEELKVDKFDLEVIKFVEKTLTTNH